MEARGVVFERFLGRGTRTDVLRVAIDRQRRPVSGEHLVAQRADLGGEASQRRGTPAGGTERRAGLRGERCVVEVGHRLFEVVDAEERLGRPPVRVAGVVGLARLHHGGLGQGAAERGRVRRPQERLRGGGSEPGREPRVLGVELLVGRLRWNPEAGLEIGPHAAEPEERDRAPPPRQRLVRRGERGRDRALHLGDESDADRVFGEVALPARDVARDWVGGAGSAVPASREDKRQTGEECKARDGSCHGGEESATTQPGRASKLRVDRVWSVRAASLFQPSSVSSLTLTRPARAARLRTAWSRSL